MEENFEKDIERAFRLKQRGMLKDRLRTEEARLTQDESQFEGDVTAALRLARRAELKSHLQNLEQAQVNQLAVRRIGGYWRYAAAASVIVIVGLGLYITINLNDNKPTAKLQLPPRDNNIAVKPVSPDTLVSNPNAQTVVNQPDQTQIATSPKTGSTAVRIFPVLAGSALGFGQLKQDTIQIIERISSSLKGTPLFLRSKEKVVLQSARKQPIQSVLTYENGLYIHIGNQFFELKQFTDLQPLLPVLDPTILEALKKIEFEQ